MEKFAKMIAAALGLKERSVEATLGLLADGCTIPFISRYRKERTGGLDEVQIARISEEGARLADLAKRKETIVKAITGQGKMTPELSRRIDDCWDAALLEDIYLPYKPKRRTKGGIARERGLEPLAAIIMLQRERNPEAAARRFVKGDVKDVGEAIKGAQDIIAENVSEDERARQTVRTAFRRTAVITAKVKASRSAAGDKSDQLVNSTTHNSSAGDLSTRPLSTRDLSARPSSTENYDKYSDYFDCSEALNRCTSHRLLAMRRGEAEGVLRVSISPADDPTERLQRHYVRGSGECQRLVADAVADAYKRLLKPSIETEFAAMSKEKADDEAIRVFAANLRQLLLAAPLGQKRVMGIDPGFRTGCKVVCLDAKGTLLHHEAVFPHPPRADRAMASRRLAYMVTAYGIEAVAIGNGTASRETEAFVRQVLQQTPVYVVSEDGASVYSASKTAREEFPDEDVTVRGAVSIGRRLMDPLAELVKIDPKSIGVGQYQHDVDQAKLKRSLDMTVESCVNSVGVNLNTASAHLLAYVSGLGPALAKNIVDYRTANGPFASRRELLKVPRLGRAAFEQCAGFLRIPGAANPLDNTAVHPESYNIVEHMARDSRCTVAELIADRKRRADIDLSRYVSADAGMSTLTDIMAELDKPGRDPRGQAEEFAFSDDVHTPADLHEGMVLPGIVTNITNFGAFVDIGVHQDGLVHISQMADRYVSDPAQVVSLHQHVRVRVTGVDLKRNRISLSMRNIDE